MPEITVSGYSDDLISVTGAIDEEFGATYSRDDDHKGDVLGFSDGTALRIRYANDGVWRITPVAHGTTQLVIEQASEDDDANYTDKATLTGDVAWVVLGKEIAHAAKVSR